MPVEDARELARIVSEMIDEIDQEKAEAVKKGADGEH
jgi:hypothetical protein